MSKHLGNVLEPIPLMDEHGADAVRWFMAAGGSPWQARRVGHAAIQEVVRKTLLTYWNTVSFQSLYARTAGWAPGTRGARRSPTARPSTAGRCPRRTGWRSEVDAALEALRHPARRAAARRLRRRPVQLVRPPLPAPVLGRRPGRARDAARVPATS